MSEMSFQEILDMPADEIRAPQALPTGTYLGIIEGQPEFTKVGQKQTDAIDFNIKPLQAQADVDAKQLAESLDGTALSDKKIRYRVFVTNDSKHRLLKFLRDDLGIPVTNFRQMIPEAMGKQIIVKLSHQASADGTMVYHQVQSTAKV